MLLVPDRICSAMSGLCKTGATQVTCGCTQSTIKQFGIMLSSPCTKSSRPARHICCDLDMHRLLFVSHAWAVVVGMMTPANCTIPWSIQ